MRIARRLLVEAKKALTGNRLGRFSQKLFLRSRILRYAPVGVTLELTSRCNLSCSYCPKSNTPARERGDLPFDRFKEIVEGLPQYIKKPQQVCLVGFGEPLLYDRLLEAIQYIKRRYPSVNVTITTNGLRLDEDVGKALIASGLNQMTISLNAGSKDAYEQINRSKDYDSVVRNTQHFLRMLNEGERSRNPLTLIQVLDEVNSASEIRQFRTFWGPYLGRNARIQVQPFVNWTGKIRSADVRPMMEPLKTQRVVSRYPCPHLFAVLNNPIITREGFVLTCCMGFLLDEEDLILGNVFDTPLKELYHGKRFRDLCDVHLRAEYERVSACQRCDAWTSHPNIWFKNPFYPRAKRWF